MLCLQGVAGLPQAVVPQAVVPQAVDPQDVPHDRGTPDLVPQAAVQPRQPRRRDPRPYADNTIRNQAAADGEPAPNEALEQQMLVNHREDEQLLQQCQVSLLL